MTAKQYLFSIRTMRDNIRKCQEGIEVIEHQMTGVSAIRYDKINVQSSPESRMETLMDKLIDTDLKLRDMQADYWREVICLQTYIYAMDKELHRKILSEYFLNCKTIAKISYELNYDRQYIYNQYSLAIKEFESIYNEHVKKC